MTDSQLLPCLDEIDRISNSFLHGVLFSNRQFLKVDFAVNDQCAKAYRFTRSNLVNKSWRTPCAISHNLKRVLQEHANVRDLEYPVKGLAFIAS